MRRFQAATLGSWPARRLPYKQTKCNRVLIAARNNATARPPVSPY